MLSRSELTALPKVELHRHLEGSLRLSTIIDLCNKLNINVPNKDYTEMFLIKEKVVNLPAFIDKMWFAQSLLATTEIIERVTFEVCEDAFLNGVKLLELRYSPCFIAETKFYDHSTLTLSNIHQSVIDGVKKAEKHYDIAVGLIGILDRTFKPHEEKDCLDIFFANNYIGLDLASDESFSCVPFADFFKQARELNIGLTCHAGESTEVKSVKEAITHLGASRIGHGFLSINDLDLVKTLIDSDIILEICPISNVKTGSVVDMLSHPVRRLLDAGVKISISTDDPGMFGSELVDEYEILQKCHGFTLEEFKKCNLDSLDASFFSVARKNAIRLKHFS